MEEAYPGNFNSTSFIEVYKSSSDTTIMDRLVCCTGCGFKYLSPRIKDNIILKSYSESQDNTFISQNSERILTFTKNFKKIVKKIKLRKGSLILDIGCAAGAFPKAAKDLGFNVVGIEPSKWLCEQARKQYNLDVRQGTLSSQKLEGEKFDVVTLWDVLEHLTDPVNELTLINKKLINHYF